MRILLLDIETAPAVAHVWGLFKENIPLDRLVESGYMLCWAAKWYGEKEIQFSSLYDAGPKTMLKGIHKLLGEADAVVHYNGQRFDMPIINKEFILHGLKPPAPYKQTDLLKVCRQQFRFQSNKMEYVVKALGLGEKYKHAGYQTWIGCMNNDPAAWADMKTYNIHDVVMLEKLYDKLKPWIKGHLNHSVFDGALVCANCGSKRLARRGYQYTETAKYPRYVCRDCGKWGRIGRSVALGPDKKFTGI